MLNNLLSDNNFFYISGTGFNKIMLDMDGNKHEFARIHTGKRLKLNVQKLNTGKEHKLCVPINYLGH